MQRYWAFAACQYLQFCCLQPEVYMFSEKSEKILTAAAAVLGGCTIAAGIGTGILRHSVKDLQQKIHQQEAALHQTQNPGGAASDKEETASASGASDAKKTPSASEGKTLSADMVREAYPFSGGYAVVFGQDQNYYILDTEGNVTGTLPGFTDQTGNISAGDTDFYNGYALVASERKGPLLIDSGGQILLDGSALSVETSCTSALRYGCLAVRDSSKALCAYDVETGTCTPLPGNTALGEPVGGGWFQGSDPEGKPLLVDLKTGKTVDLLGEPAAKELPDPASETGNAVGTVPGWADGVLTVQYYVNEMTDAGEEISVGITAYWDAGSGQFVKISDLPERIVAATENEIILQYDVSYSDYLSTPYAGMLSVWHKDTGKTDDTEVSPDDNIQCVGYYDGKFMVQTSKLEGDALVTLMDQDGKFLFEPIRGSFRAVCGSHALIGGPEMLAGTNSFHTYIVNLDTYDIQKFDSASVFTESAAGGIIYAAPDCKEYPVWILQYGGNVFECYDLLTGKPVSARDVPMTSHKFPECADGVLLVDNVYYGRNGKLLKEQGN